MQFFPKVVERISKRRGTPYISIILATVIPMAVLIAVGGNITILGELYAFGLLGAFSLTCISLDVIRWRERRDGTPFVVDEHEPDEGTHVASSGVASLIQERLDPQMVARWRAVQQRIAVRLSAIAAQTSLMRTAFSRLWPSVKFYLGIFTTVLVVGAWGVNLISKPLATAFGGTLTVLGVGISVVHYNRQRSIGEAPPMISALWRIPHGVLVVLTSEAEHNLDVARAAIESAAGRTLVFLYIAQPTQRTVRLLQFNDPYLYDEEARATLAKVAALCARARVQAQYSYRVGDMTTVVPEVWRRLRPEEIIVEAPKAKSFSKQVSPEYVRFQQVDGTRVAHFVPRAQASGVATEPRITPRPRAAVSATEGTANGARGAAPAESGVTSSSGRPAPNGHRAGDTAGPVSPGALRNGFRTKATAPSPQDGEKGGSAAKGSGGEAAGKPEESAASSRAGDKLGVDISDYVWVGTRLVRKDELERESQENGTSTGEDAPSQSNQSK
ncbi:MAG TPA: hypothetical protein VF510_05975, partial [Ktedonobacterales bacterium]